MSVIVNRFKDIRKEGPQNAPQHGAVLAWSDLANRANWQVFSAADKTYTHAQGLAAAVWTIDHNLGKYPTIQTFEDIGSSDFRQIMGLIEHLSVNQARVSFNGSISGIAVCN